MKPFSNNNSYKDTYQAVTNYIIDALKKGEIVWKKGWNVLGLPRNIISGKCYSGWNIFFLNFVTQYHHYTTPYFITFKQTQEKGGRIKKGAKGLPIIYWAEVEAKQRGKGLNEENKEAEIKGIEKEASTHFTPKTHVVFNIDQTEGIHFPKVKPSLRNHTKTIAACEQIVRNMPLKPLIEHKGDQAYYCLSLDQVTLPLKELFHSDETYYATLFHELGHSTGHPIRLNRKELIANDGLGKENYSKEELIAELTAAYLCAVSGIQQATIENSAAYIKGWLAALQNDKTLVLKAAAQAQKAADFILGTKTPFQEAAVQKRVWLQPHKQS